MKSRMDKYYNKDGTHLSRASKNVNLYKEVNTSELEDFNLNSNVSILGDNTSNIEIDKIQKILDKRYHEEPKQKLNIASTNDIETLDLNETREYDINAILDKAKETKEVDYEVERLKKIRNTQYDILNNLDLGSKKDVDEDVTDEQAKLIDLINTITSKEMASQIEKELEESDAKELDPLDLFTDLKGDNEDTMMMGIINEDLLRDSATKAKDVPVITKEFDLNANDKKQKKVEPKEPVKESISKNIDKTSEMENSFYNTSTSNLQFSQSDFDDFNDLKDDMKVAKIIIKVLIVLIIIAFLVGCFFLVNSIFDLGII
ncbi:MAG: hypothetical protein ACI31M_00790 [Bacilli bacterium]